MNIVRPDIDSMAWDRIMNCLASLKISNSVHDFYKYVEELTSFIMSRAQILADRRGDYPTEEAILQDEFSVSIAHNIKGIRTRLLSPREHHKEIVFMVVGIHTDPQFYIKIAPCYEGCGLDADMWKRFTAEEGCNVWYNLKDNSTADMKSKRSNEVWEVYLKCLRLLRKDNTYWNVRCYAESLVEFLVTIGSAYEDKYWGQIVKEVFGDKVAELINDLANHCRNKHANEKDPNVILQTLIKLHDNTNFKTVMSNECDWTPEDYALFKYMFDGDGTTTNRWNLWITGEGE